MNNKKLDKATYMYIHFFEKEDDIKEADERLASDNISINRYSIVEPLSKADLLTMTYGENIRLLSILQSVDPHQKENFERAYAISGKKHIFRTLKQIR